MLAPDPIFAHLGHLLEPLLFLPAFLAVAAAIAQSLRPRTSDHHDH
jgi:hypothetical protein